MKAKVLITISIVFLCILILISHNLSKTNKAIKEPEYIPTTTEITTEEITTQEITEEPTETSTDEITTETTIETTTEIKYTKGTIDMVAMLADFSFKDADFADNKTYKKLKNAYDKIDFSGEFKKGDLSLYDFYISKFYKLIKNEVTFYNPNEDKEMYISDLYIRFGKYDNFSIYIFDIDDDNTPELCINYRGIYAFKYIQAEDRFVLWFGREALWQDFYGTKKLVHSWEGLRDTVYILDEKGEIKTEICFFIMPINEEVTVYMAAFPYDGTDQRKVLDIETQKQGYDIEYGDLIFFRLTEEQYCELTEAYEQRKQNLREDLEEVEYTYDELFGEFE